MNQFYEMKQNYIETPICQLQVNCANVFAAVYSSTDS